MIYKRNILPVFLLLFLGAPAVHAQSDDAQTIRTLLENVAAYMQAGDLTPLNDIYAPGGGVHIIEGAGVNHGWEDYRDNHLTPELNAFENFTYTFSAIEPVVKGDIAYAAFRYELTADTSSGHIEMEGRGTAVLEKINGQWRIVHTHTSGRRKN